ncbi:MAG: tRNA pseudouridine(38-40) synthase TruA [Ruminococcaceae bacterium]|nr:tRNA pseudouridine(38-40) synthase TruA [Oscillospiraceae bacterium]
MKLLLKIRYIGTDYCGYQVQPNAVSVQQRLNEAALSLFGYECDIVGCSRTDSGVHANMFCATVSRKGATSLETSVPCEKLPLALSAHLPWDISVYGAEWVSDDFHARYDVVEKEYVYRIWNSPSRNPFEENRSFHAPKRIDAEGLLQMQRAADYLVGTQDFSSYMAQGSSVASTVRTVKRVTVEQSGEVLTLRFCADGFLYNMVRILAGTLLDVGLGKKTPEDIPRITAARDRAMAGMTMPACGLYLDRVLYRDEDKKK